MERLGNSFGLKIQVSIQGIQIHSPVSVEMCVAMSLSHSPPSVCRLHCASLHLLGRIPARSCGWWRKELRKCHCPTSFTQWWVSSHSKISQAILTTASFSHSSTRAAWDKLMAWKQKLHSLCGYTSGWLERTAWVSL